MNVLNTTKLVSAAAVAVAVAATNAPAHALTIWASDAPFAIPGTTLVTFDSSPPGTIPSPSGLTFGPDGNTANYQGGAIVQGSAAGQYRAPGSDNPSILDDTTQYLTLGGTDPSAPSPVTLSFQQPLHVLSFLWGSVDSYNSVAFYKPGAVAPFQTVTGTDLASLLGLNTPQTFYNIDKYVAFWANPGEYFDKVVLSSSQAAFETDDYQYRAVPTPALLPGLIAFGAGLLRRKQKAEAADA
jgi:hypothetical protein